MSYYFDIDPFLWTYGIWFLICIGLAIIAAILTEVFLCLWIHRDAKNHGVDATMWTVIVFFTGIIGIILYFAIGRKQTKTKCPRCFQNVDPNSPLCTSCGEQLTPENIIGYDIYAMKKSEFRSPTGFMVTFIVSFVLSVLLMIGGVVGLIVGAFEGGRYYYDSNSQTDNIAGGSTAGDAAANDYFNVSFYSESEIIERTITKTNGTPAEVYVDFEVGEGKVYLTVQQGEKEDYYEMSGSGEMNYFDISSFANGDITLLIDGSEARDVDLDFYW